MIRLFKIQYLPHCWSKNLQKHLRKVLLIEHFPTIPKEHPRNSPKKIHFDFMELSTTKLFNIKYFFLHYRSKHYETPSMRRYLLKALDNSTKNAGG